MVIAIPKGRVFDEILTILKKSNERTFKDIKERQYYYQDYFGDDVNLFIAKPKAIPQLFVDRMCDYGFCGEDIMKEAMLDSSEVSDMVELDNNRVKIVLAAFADTDITCLNRVLFCATEYPNIASRYLAEKCLPHEIFTTSGCTEGYPYLGADCIIDVCQTGETISANGLIIKDTICECSTHLYRRSGVAEVPDILKKLIHNSNLV